MKASLSRLPLGILTAFVIVTLLVFSVVIVYGGVNSMEGQLEARMLEKMPANAVEAYRDINSGKVPRPDALQALLACRDDVTHLKIEDGRGRPLGRSFGVKLWPTLVLLRDGQERARVVRPLSRADLAPIAGAMEG